MDWPPQSPDLNPIEQIWDHLDSRLRMEPQSSLDNTFECLKKSWDEISTEILCRYIHSMKKRCQEVIKAKGGHTKY